MYLVMVLEDEVREHEQDEADPDQEDCGVGEAKEVRAGDRRHERSGDRDAVIEFGALVVEFGGDARVGVTVGGIGLSVGFDDRVEVAHELGGLGDGVWHDLAAGRGAGTRLEGRGGDFVTHELVGQVMVERGVFDDHGRHFGTEFFGRAVACGIDMTLTQSLKADRLHHQ